MKISRKGIFHLSVQGASGIAQIFLRKSHVGISRSGAGLRRGARSHSPQGHGASPRDDTDKAVAIGGIGSGPRDLVRSVVLDFGSLRQVRFSIEIEKQSTSGALALIVLHGAAVHVENLPVQNAPSGGVVILVFLYHAVVHGENRGAGPAGLVVDSRGPAGPVGGVVAHGATVHGEVSRIENAPSHGVVRDGAVIHGKRAMVDEPCSAGGASREISSGDGEALEGAGDAGNEVDYPFPCYGLAEGGGGISAYGEISVDEKVSLKVHHRHANGNGISRRGVFHRMAQGFPGSVIGFAGDDPGGGIGGTRKARNS